MSVVMGVMVIVMIIGLIGFGRHHVTADHGEGDKSAVIQKPQDDRPFPEGIANTGDEETLKENEKLTEGN